jgi:hypothetical protein
MAIYGAPSSTALVLHMGLGLDVKYCLRWCQASESACEVPSCEHYAARQTDM